MSTKSVQHRLRVQDPDYLCGACAKARGWRWPKGHCATMHVGKCDVCGDERSLSCQNDWLRKGETTLWEWD